MRPRGTMEAKECGGGCGRRREREPKPPALSIITHGHQCIALAGRHHSLEMANNSVTNNSVSTTSSFRHQLDHRCLTSSGKCR